MLTTRGNDIQSKTANLADSALRRAREREKDAADAEEASMLVHGRLIGLPGSGLLAGATGSSSEGCMPGPSLAYLRLT